MKNQFYRIAATFILGSLLLSLGTMAVRWMLGLVLLTLSCLACVSNGIDAWEWFRHRRHSSSLPLIGGLFGALGLLILPLPQLASWWWLPFFLDYASLPWLLYTLGYLLWALYNKRTRL